MKGLSAISILSKIEPLLPRVQKPSQYIGGETGSIVKDRKNVRVLAGNMIGRGTQQAIGWFAGMWLVS